MVGCRRWRPVGGAACFVGISPLTDAMICDTAVAGISMGYRGDFHGVQSAAAPQGRGVDTCEVRLPGQAVDGDGWDGGVGAPLVVRGEHDVQKEVNGQAHEPCPDAALTPVMASSSQTKRGDRSPAALWATTGGGEQRLAM